jgi:hypothetical protein
MQVSAPVLSALSAHWPFPTQCRYKSWHNILLYWIQCQGNLVSLVLLLLCLQYVRCQRNVFWSLSANNKQLSINFHRGHWKSKFVNTEENQLEWFGHVKKWIEHGYEEGNYKSDLKETRCMRWLRRRQFRQILEDIKKAVRNWYKIKEEKVWEERRD